MHLPKPFGKQLGTSSANYILGGKIYFNNYELSCSRDRVCVDLLCFDFCFGIHSNLETVFLKTISVYILKVKTIVFRKKHPLGWMF
jgi:hypothetical protein